MGKAMREIAIAAALFIACLSLFGAMAVKYQQKQMNIRIMNIEKQLNITPATQPTSKPTSKPTTRPTSRPSIKNAATQIIDNLNVDFPANP